MVTQLVGDVKLYQNLTNKEFCVGVRPICQDNFGINKVLKELKIYCWNI